MPTATKKQTGGGDNLPRINSLDDLNRYTHWKTGDGMKMSPKDLKPGDSPEGFTIGIMALVQLDGNEFVLVYFDTQGRPRGEQHFKRV